MNEKEVRDVKDILMKDLDGAVKNFVETSQKKESSAHRDSILNFVKSVVAKIPKYRLPSGSGARYPFEQSEHDRTKSGDECRICRIAVELLEKEDKKIFSHLKNASQSSGISEWQRGALQFLGFIYANVREFREVIGRGTHGSEDRTMLTTQVIESVFARELFDMMNSVLEKPASLSAMSDYQREYIAFMKSKGVKSSSWDAVSVQYPPDEELIRKFQLIRRMWKTSTEFPQKELRDMILSHYILGVRKHFEYKVMKLFYDALEPEKSEEERETEIMDFVLSLGF